jgi:magnesium transporter
MIVDCAHYQDGHRSDIGPMSLEEAAARRGEGGFVWLGLFEPGEAEMDQVRQLFGLHELAVEDALNSHQRPKIEIYDKDLRLVILRTARYDEEEEEVEFGNIAVLLAPTFVITVRQGAASRLSDARRRLEQRPELLALGSTSALWAILDEVVDDYLRDVQDHLLQVEEEVAAQRDLLGTVLQANMAVLSVEQTRVSVRQNATIEQLTVLATVFLPLTFITGFFGQNFGWLVHHIEGLPAFLFYGIGGLVVPIVLLFSWLRYRMPKPDATAPSGEAAG